MIIHKISIILLIALPTTLFLWMSNIFLSKILGSDNVSFLRWLSAVFIPLNFIAWGLKRNSLSYSGAFAGFFVGFIVTLSGGTFLSCLVVFFVSSSKATKFRSSFKSKLEEDFKEGGRRNWIQVLANGFIAALIAIVYISECGCKEIPLDFAMNYRCTSLSFAFLGAFSCSNGDTWASEIGPVVKWGNSVFLITNGQSVPKGTNGGVSVAGLIASALGGLLIGFGYFLAIHFLIPSHILNMAPRQWPVIFVACLGGLSGSIIDSILGATVQYSGQNSDGIIVEHPHRSVKHISGRSILNNHGVNLVSTAITAFILPSIAYRLM